MEGKRAIKGVCRVPKHEEGAHDPVDIYNTRKQTWTIQQRRPFNIHLNKLVEAVAVGGQPQK